VLECFRPAQMGEGCGGGVPVVQGRADRKEESAGVPGVMAARRRRVLGSDRKPGNSAEWRGDHGVWAAECWKAPRGMETMTKRDWGTRGRRRGGEQESGAEPHGPWGGVEETLGDRGGEWLAVRRQGSDRIGRSESCSERRPPDGNATPSGHLPPLPTRGAVRYVMFGWDGGSTLGSNLNWFGP